MSPKYTQDMPKTRLRSAKEMHKKCQNMCQRYGKNISKDMLNIYPIYSQNMPGTCQNDAQEYLKIFQRIYQDIPKICSIYAQDMPKISPRYTQYICHRLCSRYA